MVLATKSMGLNPDVLSFAYADMSSVSSPQRPRKNITLGTERLVQFHSADPEDLGIEIEHSDDGYVRIASTSDDGMFEGTVYEGDIVCEIAGVNMRRPITEHMWKLTTGLMKVAPRPIEVIVAADESPAEGEEDEKEANGALHNVSQDKAREADNVDAEITQTPSLVKQAMSMWQSLNLSATSTKEEEQHDASDTASMSEGNEDSTVQLPDPYNDPGRFGTERTIIFHTDSLGVKLHRCPEEGIVQILHIDKNVSGKARGGDDDGRLEVGDVIVEVGGVDLRHKFIGPLEWADMVYFVQNVGRPLDMIVAEDNHFVKELDDQNVELYANGQEAEEDAASDVEAMQENTDATELLVEEESVQGAEEIDEEVIKGTEVVADEEVETESHVQSEEQLVLVHQQEDMEDEENSDAEPEDMMANLVEQYVSTEEEDVSPSVSIENEVLVHNIDRALQEMEEELSDLPRFSPEWFLLKSKLVELRAVRATIEQGGGGGGGEEEEEDAPEIKNDEGSLSSQDDTATLEPSKDASLIANVPGEKMEQKKSVNSFYFRTHPNKKISAVNDAESSVISRETVTTSDSSGPHSSPLTPTSIIEEEDVFEVITNSKQDKEVTFSSTFGEGLLSMDDGDDDEEPFTGNINFDAPPRVPVSALFSQAFVVQGGGDIGSPLFVVKRKTLTDQNKTAESSGYLQIEPQAKKAPKTLKPALDMSEIALHHDMSLESALTTESTWDKAFFANEANVQADCCLLDTLCGDQMYQGLISDSADIRQSKENTDKPRRKGLFRKLKRKKRKQERNMLGYGSLDDDGDVEDLIVTKISNKTDANGFVPIDDEVDL
jgi:hypothetical protein